MMTLQLQIRKGLVSALSKYTWKNFTTETVSARLIISKVRRVNQIIEEPQVAIDSDDDNDALVGLTLTKERLLSTSGILGDHSSEQKHTPQILKTYRAICKQYPGYMVLMQVGDFFEFFDEAAEKASQILNIAITNKKYNTAMSGIPLRSLDSYLERLLKEGISVVLVEQFEEGKNIRRKISRIITPGTLTEENILASGENNFILSIIPKSDKIGLAWIDLSTGFFRLLEVSKSGLADEFMRINPVEIIADEKLKSDPLISNHLNNKRTTFTPFIMKQDDEVALYTELFGKEFVSNQFTSLELASGASLLTYIMKTQLDKKPFIETPSRYNRNHFMHLDISAMRALEILKNSTTNTRENSLLAILDESCTAPGSRLLIQRLQAPLTNLTIIEERLDMIEYFLNLQHFVTEIRNILKLCKDLERSFQRLALNRTTGGPRDMQVIQQTLSQAQSIKNLFSTRDGNVSRYFYERIADCSSIIFELQSALEDNPPSRASDGGLIRKGYSQKLDVLRSSSAQIRDQQEALIKKYREATGRSKLTLVNKKSLGWLVEANKSESLNDSLFILDSITETKFRYRTKELEILNLKLCNHGDDAIREEVGIYEILREKIISLGDDIMNTAKIIAEIDIVTSLAMIAKRRGYCRPKLMNNSDFFIVRGRHPVVEAKHLEEGRSFVTNDCDLGPEKRFALITGPNMGGKSTFLRQNALISLMAQCGMFVPADRAEIGLVDAIYTRIGASDDLARDRSTFMVEMLETATILKNATDKSLVIMDEIGRGTASREGFALAKGICKFPYDDIKGRTLFATHYYDLSELFNKDGRDKSQCLMTCAVIEEENVMSFLHSIVPGVATKSHAIEIARLAGIPEAVLKDAEI